MKQSFTKFEKSEYGGCFPDQEYFPFYLANGTDAMLINIKGSGNSSELAYAGSYMQSLGWYKIGRRSFRDHKVVYGCMLTLFEFSWTMIFNHEKLSPTAIKQYFDPEKAVLTTFYHTVDPYSSEPITIRISTFLTREHLLVEHLELLEAPEGDLHFKFSLNSPSSPYLRLYDRLVAPDQIDFDINMNDSCLKYHFAFHEEKLEGGAYFWLDRTCDTELLNDNTYEQECVRGELGTTLKKGEAVTRYLVALDSMDSADYRKDMSAVLDTCRSKGYRAILESHCRQQEAYLSTCSVTLPDDRENYLYDLHRYVIRANHSPEGFQPVGSLPYMWQGAMFWDAYTSINAYLSSGNYDYAQRVVHFLSGFLEDARALARRFGSKGARLEWSLDLNEFTRYPGLVTQFHNNSIFADSVFQCYNYSGDREFLREHFEFMEELVFFMFDHCMKEDGDAYIMGSCTGIDESVGNPKTNDTWTCAFTLKALMSYQAACHVLEKESKINDLAEVIRKLRKGLDANVDADGILQSFRGGRAPHTGSIVFDLFPDHPAHQPTIHRLMQNYDADLDLYNVCATPQYFVKSKAQESLRVAKCLARINNSDAMILYKDAIKKINYFGAMSERLWYHGENLNHWFSTASGAYVETINCMMANFYNNTLYVFNGISEIWKDVSFTNISTQEGFVVSASMQKGALVSLVLRSVFSGTRTIKIKVNGKDLGSKEVAFEPVQFVQ